MAYVSDTMTWMESFNVKCQDFQYIRIVLMMGRVSNFVEWKKIHMFAFTFNFHIYIFAGKSRQNRDFVRNSGKSWAQFALKYLRKS